MKLQYKSIVIATLLAAVLIVTGCGGAEQRKAKYVENSKTYIEQQNYEKAKIELKNALQIDPKYAEAYYLMGLVEEKKQNWQAAFGSYSKAVELNPDYFDARAKLGRLYLLSGDLVKATEMMDKAQALQPDSAVVKALKIAMMAKKGDLKGALQNAEELAAKNPSSPDAIDLLASLYLGQQNMDKAADVLKMGVTANPKNIPFRMTLAQIYLGKKEYEKAEQILQEVVRMEPDKLQPRVILTTFYSQTNQADKAEKTMRDAIQADPRDFERYLLLADFLASRKEYARVETELLAAIKENPKVHKLRFGLAKAYEITGATDKVMGVYRDIVDIDGTGPDGLVARNRLAGMLLIQGQQNEPEKLVKEVLKENPQDNDALIIQGKLAMLKGNALDAISSFRSVLKDQPASVDILALLADAHMMNKSPELAKESLYKAVELNSQDPKARLPLAQFLVRSGDFDGALKKIDEAIKIAPKDLDVLSAKAQIYAARRDTRGVQSTFMQIKQAHPDKPIGYYQLGQLYVSQKKYDDAIREFEQALQRSPGTFQPLSAIISANLLQGKPEKAIDRLNRILKETPNHPFAHELLAEAYIKRKQYPEAEKELRAAIVASPKWNVPYRNLANLYLVQGQFSAAENVYRQGLQAIPDDPELLFHLAVSYERTRDYAKAISTYEGILRKNPSYENAVNNLAYLLVDVKSDSDSLKRAKELALRLESAQQPVYRDTLGWVYFKSGEVDKALGILKDVVKQTPSVPTFNYHLGMVYYKQGNMTEARTYLGKAVDAKNEFPGQDEARATLKQIH